MRLDPQQRSGFEVEGRLPPKAALPSRVAARAPRAIGVGVIVLASLALGCLGARGPEVLTEPSAVAGERTCAWYGDRGGDVLYFGEAAFWSSMRAAGGDPTADLRAPNPQRIGRFDLAARRLLPALDVSDPAHPGASGVWDVMAHANGRVYFTTYFETSGWVDPATGETRRFAALGVGLNELAPGPAGSIVASRYGAPGGGGSIVIFDPDGTLIAEHPLHAKPGVLVAPKTVAYDALADVVWVVTDLVTADGRSVGHDARIVDRRGQDFVVQSGGDAEIQFVLFDAAGVGYFVERRGARLILRISSRGATAATPSAPQTRELVLDEAFAAQLDFAQDLRVAPDGRVVVTRWSGEIDVVDPSAPDATAVQRVRLPRLADGGLYYTGVLTGERVCATLCADVQVVCALVPR